ncbi:MAG: hypothetical protein JRJ02_09895 [Deltaproteobacteria bacterium]|nr:hypothetical protein [Deltaproteobacteria bacterium]
MKRENAMRGGGAAKAKDKDECENKGCIFVRKNTSVDIEAGSTRINCENGRSHPLEVWRVKNDSKKNGYVKGYKKGFQKPSGKSRIKTIKAKKHKYNCENNQYEATAAEKNFNLYTRCEDKVCGW